jgi:hypothetical protein
VAEATNIGVPLISPVAASSDNPEGRVPDQLAIIPPLFEGLMVVIVVP